MCPGAPLPLLTPLLCSVHEETSPDTLRGAVGTSQNAVPAQGQHEGSPRPRRRPPEGSVSLSCEAKSGAPTLPPSSVHAACRPPTQEN